MNRRQAIILIGAAVAPWAHADSPADAQPHVDVRGLMGTRFEIRCHHPDQALARTASDLAFTAAERLNAIASDYIADSELLGLSKHPAGTPVAVSPKLFSMIQSALEIARKTDGRFDPTLGPLTRLWRESRRRKQLPDEQTLATARASCGWQDVVLDPEKSTLTFRKNGMRLDLGGIAKGQAADEMLGVMRQHGITLCCITAGGDVRAGDPPPGAKGWKIAVRTFDPKKDTEILELAGCGVSTSGDLHQSIEINGVRYSHIIDPTTGLGLTREIAATVIAPSSTLSDPLATACCVADPETAAAMAKSAGASEVHLAE